MEVGSGVEGFHPRLQGCEGNLAMALGAGWSPTARSAGWDDLRKEVGLHLSPWFFESLHWRVVMRSMPQLNGERGRW